MLYFQLFSECRQSFVTKKEVYLMINYFIYDIILEWEFPSFPSVKYPPDPNNIIQFS